MIELDSGEVHVWWIPFKSDFELSILSDDELERMKRFRNSQHGAEYGCYRSELRKLLSLYLPGNSAKFEFSYSDYGKPNIKNTDIAFNLSHSRQHAVCAITKNQPIGIDCEAVTDLPDMRAMASVVFTEVEKRALFQLPITRQKDYFYQLWTSKEAVLKAMGTGLTFAAMSIQVGTSCASLVSLLGVEDYGQWQIMPLRAPTGYLATFATRVCQHIQIMNDGFRNNLQDVSRGGQ